MDVGLVIGLVLFLVFVTLGVIVTVRATRAVKRGVERTGAQVRRTVEETTLKARAMQPGPVGEVARVRMELRSSVDSTRAALEAGARDDPALTEAISLLDQLHEHARQLDGELRRLMEGEPDRARIAARLPDARERMKHIRESADSLRFAAQDRARQFDSEGLDDLRSRIDIETGALRHWTPTPGRSPHDPSADPAPSQDSSPDAARRPGGQHGRSTAAGEQGPGARDAGEAGEGRHSEARPAELGPAGQALDPSLTDPTTGRKRAEPGFEKRRPRSAS
ncbi:hypothetical protein [Streptomyces axinellae]|uniref:Secreted protein n=1 Tax=Streptomyces axinellae TaxID=552788 RepID=A0ABN3PPU5_9ACTN